MFLLMTRCLFKPYHLVDELFQPKITKLTGADSDKPNQATKECLLIFLVVVKVDAVQIYEGKFFCLFIKNLTANVLTQFGDDLWLTNEYRG